MEKILSIFCALLWLSQALLHLLLLLGLPLGNLVLGGSYAVIPLRLRPVNLLLLLLWTFFGLCYLYWAGCLKSPFQKRTLKKIIFGATGFLFLAAIFNFFISPSLLERYLTGGLTALAFLASLLLLILDQ